MNFAQICFSPTEFLNGKSMAARDSTSLKDNVSKCQLLGFRSFPPESAMSAICTGLYGLKGKDSLAGPSWLRAAALLGSPPLWALSGSVRAQPFRPCWLSERERPANEAEWRVILPTWHHFDHLRKQTNKRKTKQQKCMLAAGCLWKVPLKPLHLGQPQRTRHPEGHMWVEGLLSPESWLTVIRRHLLITYTSPSFQEHRSDVKIYKGPIKYLPKHLYNGRKGQS